MRNIGLVALFIGVLGVSACSDQGKQFAATTDRIAGYIGTGLVVVDQLSTAEQISPETATAIVTVLRQVNTINGQVIVEAKKYVKPDGTLALTGDGQQKILTLVSSANGLVTNLLNDSRVINLPEAQRKQINAFSINLKQTLIALDQLIKTIKLVR